MDRVDVRAIPPGDDEGIAEYVRVRCAVTPENPDSVEQVRWEDASYPGEVVRLLARRSDGVAIGTASTGRIWMHSPSYERYWLGLWVLPESRNRGIGGRLLDAVSTVARSAGKTGFQTELSEAQVEGHRFLAARGFVEVERMKSVRLELAGLTAPRARPVSGIRITSLAAEPALLAGVHRVAVEAFPDVPTGDEPLYVGTLDEFVARDVDRASVPRDAFMVAVDEASGEAVGYANLVFQPGSTTVAMHDMTAVRPRFRGRGIATALKHATISWAVAHGLDALETGNDEMNAPMRAVNRTLGYRPIPDWIGLHGPLAARR
jgi:GNAT superfamily N-acetyltransferase